MEQDDDDSNSVWSDLELMRYLDQRTEDSKALKPRGKWNVTVVDKENNRYKLSRHDISETMPIHRLSVLFIPELDKKDERALIEKKIIHAIEYHGLKYSYIPDLSVPFANLTDNQKRRSEINLYEFIRIYETGRLYDGAEKHISCWQSEINKANEEYRAIKEITYNSEHHSNTHQIRKSHEKSKKSTQEQIEKWNNEVEDLWKTGKYRKHIEVCRDIADKHIRETGDIITPEHIADETRETYRKLNPKKIKKTSD